MFSYIIVLQNLTNIVRWSMVCV